jgi:hypothetical protein
VFLLEALGATQAPQVLCCRISSNNSFFGCVSAGGGVTSGTTDRQGAVTVLLHFFKHVFLSFCWRQRALRHGPSRCCVAAFLQTIPFLVVFLLEAASPVAPATAKVL